MVTLVVAVAVGADEMLAPSRYSYEITDHPGHLHTLVTRQPVRITRTQDEDHHSWKSKTRNLTLGRDLVRFRKYLIALLLDWSFLMAVPLVAQHSMATDCLGALAKDYYKYSDSSHLSLDWLKSIDEQTYASAKKDNSFSLLGIFSGGAFNLSDDFSSFDQKRSKYLESNHYTRSESDAKEIVSLTTSERAYTAYETCLRTIGSNGGVLVWASRTTMNEIDLVVRYANPTGRPSARLVGTLIGGSVAGQPKGQLWKRGLRWGTMGEKPFTIIPTQGVSATTVRVQDEFGGPVTDITFQRADGIMKLQYVGTTSVLRNRDFTTIGPTSPDNNGNDGNCPNPVGRDGGGYCKSGTTVSFAVAAPNFLQNARGNVIGSGGPWSETWMQAEISPDGLMANYGRANWGPPVNPTLTVDIWQHLDSGQCGLPQATPVLLGQQVVFNVANQCLPIASVQWKTFAINNTGVVKAGTSSPDGAEGVDAATPINSGDSSLIGYKLRRHQGAPSQHAFAFTLKQ